MTNISEAQKLYNQHHSDFEKWFSGIHPNHDLTLEWVEVFDSGWYLEDLANGAWIAWLSLTGKHEASLLIKQRALLKQLGEYSAERFSVSLDELWSGYPTNRDDDATILSDKEFQDDFKLHPEEGNIFLAITMRALKLDLEDFEPHKDYESIHGFDFPL
jgi:hypothetical protein